LKNRNIWLVGSTSETLIENKLPSNRQTLCKYFNLHFDNNFSIQQSSILTAREVITFCILYIYRSAQNLKTHNEMKTFLFLFRFYYSSRYGLCNMLYVVCVYQY